MYQIEISFIFLVCFQFEGFLIIHFFKPLEETLFSHTKYLIDPVLDNDRLKPAPPPPSIRADSKIFLAHGSEVYFSTR